MKPEVTDVTVNPKEMNFMNAKIADRIFDVAIIIITLIAVFACLFPILNVVAVSLSSNSAILGSKVFLWPVEFNLQSYMSIFKDQSMFQSLWYTIFITVVYTVMAMILTICAAYPLTKKRLKGRTFFLLVIIITMYFSGGLIPDYLLIKSLNLMDNMWSLILPGVLSAFNLIILKTFFTSLPDSLEESAILDGCSDIGVLVRIILPLSTPVLATLSLFYAVGKWNSFMDALFYITNPKLYPLQLKLYMIIVNSQMPEVAEGTMATSSLLPESLKAACVVFATVPIILVYPWLQRYFVKGIMIGAIKG